MDNLKTHNAVFEAASRDVFWALDVFVWRTGDWGVEVIVKEAVNGAVNGAVSGTVSSASWFGPEYPALQGFLRAVEVGKSLMNNSNANYALGAAVIWAADDAVDEANAVSGTVDEAVKGVVKDAVHMAVRRAVYGAVEAVVWKGLEREVHWVVSGTIDCWDVYNALRREPTSIPKIQSFLRESYARDRLR